MTVLLKTTYDESLGRFAPGRILLYRVIQEKFALHPDITIEFYTNATREQKEWTNFDCTIQNLQIFASEPFATAFSILKAIQQIMRGACRRKNQPDVDVASLPTKVDICKSVDAFSSAQFDLHEFSATDNIETSIDWFDILQKNVYLDDPGVRYYFVSNIKHPTAILPLRLITKGKIRAVESLSNYYTSLFTPLLTKNSNQFSLRHILASASHDSGNAHVMRFAPMDPHSSVFMELMNELRAIGWIPFRFYCFVNWYMKVTDDWEGYLKKKSANFRSNIKRKNNKFSSEGGTLEIVTDCEGIEQAIAAFQDVYIASWKIPEPYPNFVSSLIRHLSSNGMLRLGIARLHERPIAAQLWIVSQNKASIYKVAYDEEFSSLSPGTVLTSHLLQHVIEQDHVKEVDFLIGNDEYKKTWMSDRRERWGIVAYNPRTLIGTALMIKEIIGRLSKPLWNRIKSPIQKARGGNHPPNKIM